MGRWKNNGSGQPVWDEQDQGPDQLPAPQSMGMSQPQAPSFTPPNGNTGVAGGRDIHAGPPMGGGMGPGQGDFNPPNVWKQPDEGEKPGWGPIKISTHYQPGEGQPHPFEGGFGMGGQKDGMNQGQGAPMGSMPHPGLVGAILSHNPQFGQAGNPYEATDQGPYGGFGVGTSSSMSPLIQQLLSRKMSGGF